MEDLKALVTAVAQIAEEKGIEKEAILEVIEVALAAALKKDTDRKGENIQAKLDTKTGTVEFWQVLDIVDDSMIYSEDELEDMKESEEEIPEEERKVRFNPKKHILIEEAIQRDKNAAAGEELRLSVKAEGTYGRIAAQTAKQVILQRLKEVERNSVLEEYKDKEGEIISGTVQRIEGRNIFFDIGKTLGILLPLEQIPGEHYRIGDRYRLILKSIEPSPRGPSILLSRAYPKFVTKLFEIEVPEVSAGQVEVKSIAREAGYRTKLAVVANEDGIDPIGAMVGQRGTRVMAVINSLNGEKIDIILWDEDPEQFIINALSPAKITEVKVMDKEEAIAVVPEDQLSLAIGKGGQNVRLAARLTGWKIDIQAEGASAPIPEEELEKVEVEEVEEPKEVIEKIEVITEEESAKEEITEEPTEEQKEEPKKKKVKVKKEAKKKK
jgi:transcription termination/antitermination protein NusA